MDIEISKQRICSPESPEAALLYRSELETRAQTLINNREALAPPEIEGQERLDNARTALFEAMTASGHLSRVEITGSLTDIHTQLTSRLVNGWDDGLNWHEKQRRFAELCNELYIQDVHAAIIANELPANTIVTEISDYPCAMDPKTARSLGYRDSNRKGMVRSTSLELNEDGSFTRVIEQVSRANSSFDISRNFLTRYGRSLDNSKPDDLAILEAPLIHTTEEVPEGVVDVVRQLDQLAGPGVRYGDPAPRAGIHVPYEQVRQESARRENQIGHYTHRLAAFESNLDELVLANKISQAEKQRQYKDQVMRILNAVCTLNPSYAEDTFGKKASGYYYEAAELVSRGDLAGAEALLMEAEQHKQSVTFCGMEISVEQAEQKGLRIDAYGNLVDAGIESWQWKSGQCRVENCPTKPGEVKVGPCEVCEHCQKIYDQGKDPKNVYPSAKKITKVSLVDAVFAKTYQENRKAA